MPHPQSLKGADGQHALLDQVISGGQPNHTYITGANQGYL
jgi:hypothetical protein